MRVEPGFTFAVACAVRRAHGRHAPPSLAPVPRRFSSNPPASCLRIDSPTAKLAQPACKGLAPRAVAYPARQRRLEDGQGSAVARRGSLLLEVRHGAVLWQHARRRTEERQHFALAHRRVRVARAARLGRAPRALAQPLQEEGKNRIEK